MLERIRRRAAVLGGLLAGLAAAALPAAAAEIGTLTVVSSFPPSLYEPFRAAFEARHPQWRLRIINRKTSSAIDYVRSDRGAQVDVFWASAPDAFEVLKTHGLLAVLRPRAVDAPKTIGGFPINDPDGHYLGFALSGYGVFWNQDYLERHGLPPPQDWRDLTDPRYARHIALTPPSRSGTMHLMVEAMLQSLGWEQGWALLQEIGANAATLTARSFSVVEGVARQRFGLGITIDFLGLTYSAKNPHSHFSYPQGGIFLPASVAILKASPNRAAAEAFVDFLLSAPGQELLLHPEILRMPVSRRAYAQATHPNPYHLAAQNGVVFDSKLSSRRYGMVNLLFDHLITYRLPQLQETWRRIHEGEALLRAARPAPEQAARLLAEARALAGAVPLTAEEAEQAERAADLGRPSLGATPAPSQQELERRLSEWTVARFERAMRLAEQALQQLRSEPLRAADS
ncbi:MAG: extracellular solute-binding protein [Xanthomonadaceae bacterium]|nr:extracellular solute-binding protein [Xanthomonadaceae bacterium]